MNSIFYFFQHIDQHLLSLVSHYGSIAYFLLFFIIFCETGLVILPFLPGDSILFAAGTLSAHTIPHLNIHLLFFLLLSASFLGNTLNYFMGRFVGPKVFSSPTSWLFNKRYLNDAHRFYEQYGGKTIIIARFIPILRTFAPFVAGIGSMEYRLFLLYNFVGALLWVGGLLYLSYLFGNINFVKNHFSFIAASIIFISLLLPFLSLLKKK